jgi:hypothetical protein
VRDAPEMSRLPLARAAPTSSLNRPRRSRSRAGEAALPLPGGSASQRCPRAWPRRPPAGAPASCRRAPRPHRCRRPRLRRPRQCPGTGRRRGRWPARVGCQRRRRRGFRPLRHDDRRRREGVVGVGQCAALPRWVDPGRGSVRRLQSSLHPTCPALGRTSRYRRSGDHPNTPGSTGV